MMEEELKKPEIGEYVRNIGTLLSIEDVKPPPQHIRREYIFEEREARVELRLNGEVIKILCVLNDFYGLDECVKGAIKEAEEYSEKRSIKSNSDCEVVVIRVRRQYRAKPTWVENFVAKGYTAFESLDFGSLRDLPLPIETKVWSTK